MARIRAWEIALDAQLAGGDAEISMSRLVLTILASGTLPEAPHRLMLKALHIHVLLWEAANNRLSGRYLYRSFAKKFARYQWEKARKLQKQANISLPSNESSRPDTLPGYLAELLELDIDIVMQDTVVQSACNLAWNRPTVDNVSDCIDGMDSIIDDPAIRSPLDALAAWCSCIVLQKVLVNFLEARTGVAHSKAAFKDDVDLALRISPTGSLVQSYCLVARAVLLDENRGANIAAALQALPPSWKSGSRTPTIVNAISPSSKMAAAPPELGFALQCAMAVTLLQRPQHNKAAIVLIEQIGLSYYNLGLLGFAAAYNLLDVAFQDKILSNQTRGVLENVARALKLWVSGKQGRNSALGNDVKGKIAMLCVKVLRWLVGMRDESLDDQGYWSMSHG